MTSSTLPTEMNHEIHPDAVLSAVANERRREVLRILVAADEEQLPLDTLVNRLVERLREEDDELPVDEYRQRVRTELYHSHLPKLEACGMVVHDTETKQVKNVTGELGQELLVVVESHDPHE
ncbi:DUF7344 domain-containing protein [Salinibaculum salinum]|uniref:DUF7344 domain-containing protein n=1 Tax=Salinibaculum salinum TaxID=3131996 RepID=UPI0030EC4633